MLEKIVYLSTLIQAGFRKSTLVGQGHAVACGKKKGSWNSKITACLFLSPVVLGTIISVARFFSTLTCIYKSIIIQGVNMKNVS